MIAGLDAQSLEVGGAPASLLVELVVRDPHMLTTDHEGEGMTPRGTSFDPLVQCQHVGYDLPSGALVTGRQRVLATG